jgi:hypothetical protein
VAWLTAQETACVRRLRLQHPAVVIVSGPAKPSATGLRATWPACPSGETRINAATLEGPAERGAQKWLHQERHDPAGPAGETGPNREVVPGVQRGEESETSWRQDRSHPGLEDSVAWPTPFSIGGVAPAPFGSRFISTSRSAGAARQGREGHRREGAAARPRAPARPATGGLATPAPQRYPPADLFAPFGLRRRAQTSLPRGTQADR